MRDLVTKLGRFAENHVEKLVLVIVGLVCAWLFFTRVIFSPNMVMLGGKQYSPGQVDEVVKARADELNQVLQSPDARATAPTVGYASPITGPIAAEDPSNPLSRPLPQGFAGVFESPLSSVNMDIAPPVPSAGGEGVLAGAQYKLPPIGRLTDVGVKHIRAAAWVPLQEVTAKNTYDKVEIEANDVDLVTVEAQYDAAQLCRQFKAHFAGEEVEKEEWRDPCLAEPVFAAVQLQRQELLDDGAWSAWQEVPRPRIDSRRELFAVIERIEDLPAGGLKVRLMRFDRPDVTMQLLQPESYQIASAEEEWFPPSFYDEFKSLQKKVEMEERRKEREEERERRDQTTSGRRRDTFGGTGGTGRATGAGGRYRSGTTGGGAMGDGGYGTRGRSRSGGRTRGSPGGAGAYGADYGYGTQQQGTRSRSGRRGRTAPGDEMMYDPGMYMMDGTMAGQAISTDEAYRNFAEKLIRWDTDLSKLDEPLLLWAIDDTARPGGTYQYRMRLGVFNPVAGANRVAERDKGKSDQVILWSDFSPVTEPVNVPKMLYFFAKGVEERQNTALVEVARYKLGYWRTEDFKVKPGEVIGKEMEPKDEEEDRRRPGSRIPGRITDPAYANYGLSMDMAGAPAYGLRQPDDPSRPDIIDFRTGQLLVDLVQVSDWGAPPNIAPPKAAYHEMLYTGDGTQIEHMPVGTANWPKDLLASYQDVLVRERKEKQPFRDFKKGGMRGRIQPGMMDGYPAGMEGYYGDDGGMMGGSPYGPYGR